MANWCSNRMEILFSNTAAETAFVAKHISEDSGRQWIDITERSGDSDILGENFGKITDQDRGDNNSLIIYFESRWNSPVAFFTELVTADKSISLASLEYSEPNMAFVGSVEWDGTTKTITDSFRTGEDLSEDDLFILYGDKCETCQQFNCDC